MFKWLYGFFLLKILQIFQERVIFKPYPRGILPLRSPRFYSLHPVKEGAISRQPLSLGASSVVADGVLAEKATSSTSVNLASKSSSFGNCLRFWHYSQADSYATKVDGDVTSHIYHGGSAPCFIFFHGNTGHIANLASPRKAFAYDNRYRLALLNAIISYRADFFAFSLSGYGGSSGKPSEANFKRDVDLIAKNLLINRKNTNYIIIGESLGAFSALYLTNILLENGIVPNCTCLIAPFTNIIDKTYERFPILHNIKPANLESSIRHYFDNKKQILKLATLLNSNIMESENFLLSLFHPECDEVTPKSHSQALHKQAESLNIKSELKIIKDATHITWSASDIVSHLIDIYIASYQN